MISLVTSVPIQSYYSIIDHIRYTLYYILVAYLFYNWKLVLFDLFTHFLASQVVLVVKNLPANEGDIRDMGSSPGSGRSPGEGSGNPVQCSCLENPMDRGAWWATVHGVANSWTRLKQFSP